MKFCQSCGMPLQAEDQWGTNADGSLNEEYCCYCYQKGAFTQDYTMEEMIGHCLQFLTNSTGRPMFPGPGNKPWQK